MWGKSMKYKELNYGSMFIIPRFVDIGKNESEIDISKYQRIYTKKEHHAFFYVRDKRTGEFVFGGCEPIDLEEDVIEITEGVE